jgi:hypothetical protein
VNCSLDHCDWQWLFGFENREGIFDIHRSFKFCPLIVQKGGTTQAIRAAFMHRNVDDWANAERHVLAYPRERVLEFSPYSKAIVEIRSDKDLRVLQKIYANGVLLGDQSERGWGVKYATEFHMTNDSKLFPPRLKWEERGYRPDEYGHWLKGPWQAYKGPANIIARDPALVLSRDGLQALRIDEVVDVALPLFQGGMVNIYDKNASGYIVKVSAQATWQAMEFNAKEVLPQYLISRQACVDRGDRYTAGLKLAFRDIARNTDMRSAIGSLVSGFPCGNTLGVFSGATESIAAVGFAFSTIAFDWLVRKRLGGTHINLFVAEECAVTTAFRIGLQDYVKPLLGLVFPDHTSAPVWVEFFHLLSKRRSWRHHWAITPHERARRMAILEAIAFKYFGLEVEEAELILEETDRPVDQLTNKAFCRSLDQRGFWRIDKSKEPELRHPILSLVALHDLELRGLSAFMNQNDGEGWFIPETLRLSDYGLGYDVRAKVAQPVAPRLGPRFLDWQLGEDVSRSWEECAAHAELIRRIVPLASIRLTTPAAPHCWPQRKRLSTSREACSDAEPHHLHRAGRRRLSALPAQHLRVCGCGPVPADARVAQPGADAQHAADEGPLHLAVAHLPAGRHAGAAGEGRGAAPAHQAVVAVPVGLPASGAGFRAIRAGRPTLVATGTGSGKTECFLLPIISRCLQLRDASAPAGITAVIVYPMNALAEDQLQRMRALLAGTGVSFGMYVGKTPRNEADVTGVRLPPGSTAADYKAKLAIMQQKKEDRALHPAEERASREAMRKPGNQPRILLTNVKQLELLLTRQQDLELFDNALLEFLVFDEAHTFTGAQGAETACLIRRLRAYCGKDEASTRASPRPRRSPTR